MQSIMCNIRVGSKSILLLLFTVALMASTSLAQVSSVVKLNPDPNPVVQGQNITFTGSVNWTGSASPTGTITINDSVVCSGASSPTVAVLGTIALGAANSATPGVGKISISSFPCTGDNSISGEYSGDSVYTSGKSQSFIVSVLTQFSSTSTNLFSSLNPAAVGQSITLTAKLGFALTLNSYPTGTITFTDAKTGNVLGSAAVQTSGSNFDKVSSASITTSSLSAGSYNIKAAYSGNNIYGASSSQIVSQIISGTSNPGSPSISSGGVVTASQFGGFSSISPGTFIEIYGSNLASNARPWAISDFKGINAPTSLDGTSVIIGGQAAFISYISPNQVNVQVPSNIAAGSQQLILSTTSGSTVPYTVNVSQIQPGLFAPDSYSFGGKQYAGALFPDGVTWALPPGSVPGITSRAVKPGDIVVMYGVGFGSVTPDSPAGQLVQMDNTLAAPIQFLFGSSPAVVKYSGLAPQFVGLYQFNVVVPNIASSDAVPLSFSLGGIRGTQTLFLPVQN